MKTNIHKISTSFYGFGIFLTVIALILVYPFLDILIFTLLLTYVGYPLRRAIFSKIENKTIAASITTIIVLLCVVIPTLWGLSYLSQTSMKVAQSLTNEGVININLSEIRAQFFTKDIETFLENIDVPKLFHEPIFNTITDILSLIPKLLLKFLLFLFFLYYFIRDGPEKLENMVNALTPEKQELLRNYFQIADMSLYATVFGRFSTGFVCAIVSTLGFSLISYPFPVFFGILTAIIFIIPQIGVWAIFVPLAVYEVIIKQNITKSFFLLVFGGVVGIVDTVVYSVIVGEHLRSHGIHPLLTIVGLFGGLFVFGVKGLILGPVIMSLAVSFLNTIIFEQKRVQSKN